MPNFITLADYSALLDSSGDTFTSGIVDTLREDGGMFMEQLPIKTTGKLRAKGHRIKDLPTVQNRDLNEAYTHAVGHSEPLEETVFMYGGRIQLDYLLDGGDDDLIEDPEAFQIRLHTQAQTWTLKDDIINNTPSAKPKGLVGLRYRLLQDFSGQRLDAGALDISDDSGGTNDAAFVQKLRRAVYSMADHTADLLLMNDTTLLALRRILDNLKLLKTTEDSFGRQIERWGDSGPFLVDMGLMPDQSTKIITDLEDAGGEEKSNASTKTSIFGVRFGPEYLTGWEKSGMQTFRWQEGVLKYVEFDWPVGLFITNPRSVMQLYNIQAA